jgi:catechol 2,3-dioxygenase-like lactoylglutathione lyase family enzyme
VSVQSSGNALPPPTVIGTGGRIPPTAVIEDDATGNVEAIDVFDPASDGIDFYESLEGMRVRVNSPVAVGPSNNGEIAVIGDDGANAGVRTASGGIVVRPNDFNPERIILGGAISGGPNLPLVNVGDHFDAPAIGVLDYSTSNYKLEITAPLNAVSGNLAQETVEFYTKVLGLKYAAGEQSPEGARPYGEEVDLIHIFFECGDGSYIAFFDLPSSPPMQADPNTPSWVNHIAFEVPSVEALLEGKRHLEAAGVDVLGPKDHSFCQSIYFFDPNGIRLEMTARTEAPGELDRMEQAAEGALAAWNARKLRKYGVPA